MTEGLYNFPDFSVDCALRWYDDRVLGLVRGTTYDKIEEIIMKIDLFISRSGKEVNLGVDSWFCR